MNSESFASQLAALTLVKSIQYRFLVVVFPNQIV